ncbi:uncharacterized protein LOC135821277 isoform X2 [Sycon ciliatum]|uniref:uncharacterized protein LOC135821277 isoform X2 n=1 Tax=Sycon ciliatum TaxID=27933 RepID=UPI0031F630DA
MSLWARPCVLVKSTASGAVCSQLASVSSCSMPIVGATVLESRVASEVVIRQADGGKVRLKSSTSGKWPAYHPNGHRNGTRRIASLRDKASIAKHWGPLAI